MEGFDELIDYQNEMGTPGQEYSSPSPEQIEASGDLPPIDDPTQQANQQLSPSNVLGGAAKAVTGAAGAIHGAIVGNKWQDLEAWKNMPEGPEREQAREQYFQTHYGKSYEEIKDQNMLEYLGNDFKNQQLTTSSWAGASLLSLLDLPMDAIGMLPGGAAIDDGYDEFTKFNDPLLQNFRKLSGIVLPTIMTSGMATKALAPTMAKDMPWLSKALINVGAYGALDTALIGVSDIGEEENTFQVMAEFFPEVFGRDGWLPIPKGWQTHDGDSPSVRKQKNMYETAGLSVIGNVLGYFLQAGKPALKWFRPVDKTAFKYRNIQETLNADNEVLFQIQELDELLAKTEGKINRKDKNLILERRKLLVQEAESDTSLESYVKKAQKTQEGQVNDVATRKLETNPENIDIDPDVNPMFVREANRAQQSLPPGNVARNMGDNAALDAGDTIGTPAPIISESMRNKVLRSGDTSRGAVLGVAEAARDAGEFKTVINGIPYNKKKMNESAWNIYKKIMEADNLDDVKNLYFNNKSVNQLADIVAAGSSVRNVKELTEADELLGGSLAALRDLTDRYLGRGIMQSSARVMDTLGKEMGDMSQAIRTLAPHVDEDRAMDLILDKMEFLLTEVGINKYIRGWQLQRINAWTELLESVDDSTSVINTLKAEFTEAETAIAKKSQKFTQELRRVKDENPLAVKALVTQFERSEGSVDTIAKLMEWAQNEITPWGLLKSPNPNEMNKFAQGAFAVAYNNMLSGLATGGAVLGNSAGLIGKPITAVLGGGLEGLLSGGNFNNLKRSMYYYGGVMETNRRIIKDAWNMAKKSWKDPDAMLKAARADMVQQETIDWTVLENIRDVWEESGEWGKVAQLDVARVMYDLSRWAPFRVGMVGLTAADAGLSAATATYVSRLRAYDDVFSKYGKVDIDNLRKAEKKHYDGIFDKNGLIDDDAAKVITGELALNLQDDLSDTITQGVTKYPFLKTIISFPKTLTNNLKLQMSWVGVQAIPGLTKYGDVIWARTDEDIAKALRNHGLDPENTPNARTIFENLRTEYRGRMAFSGMLVSGLYGYAMAGNVTGNGSHEPTQRRIDRDQFGFQRKSIKVGDKWVSYEGIPMVDPVLTILGDLAYYGRDITSPIVEDIENKLLWTLSATFLQNSVFTGLEPLVAILNGDLTQLKRYVSNTTRMFLPMSGAAGVLAKAIDSSQKDIHDNVMHYILNRTPFLNQGLPKQVDIYTGNYVNDIENPTLRILNAISKVKVSGTNEPWRVTLRDIGYDGASVLKKDSTGMYEYTGTEREYINKLVGEQEPWRKIEKLLKSPKYQDQINQLRAHVASGGDLGYDRITIDGRRLPIYREIDKIMREAQQNAEFIMMRERPDIWETVTQQRLVNRYIEQGQIDEAQNVGNKNQQMVENLINLPK